MVNAGDQHEDITVTALWVFPIKSAKGFKVESWPYGEEGLEFDRQWMIVEDKTHNFLTARTIPKVIPDSSSPIFLARLILAALRHRTTQMVLLEPSLDLVARTLTIHVPELNGFPSSTHTIPIDPPASSEEIHETDFKVWGVRLDGYLVGTPELDEALSNFMGKEVRLVRKGEERREAGPDDGWVQSMKWVDLDLDDKELPPAVGFADQYATLLVSTNSLAQIKEEVLSERVQGMSRLDKKRWNEKREGLEIERFRGNIVVSGNEPWSEDGWGELRFVSEVEGKKREEVMYAVQRCARCMLPNVDPANGVRDAVVPDLVLRPYREGLERLVPDKVCFGMNMVAKKSKGTVNVGDKVVVVTRYPQVEGGKFDRPEDHMPITW